MTGLSTSVVLPLECGLKACFAKLTDRYQFLDKTSVMEAHTHAYAKLVTLAGLRNFLKVARENSLFDARWSIVSKWNPEARYAIAQSRDAATTFYNAIAAKNQGVFQWIRLHW